jgi:hypothetical protein
MAIECNILKNDLKLNIVYISFEIKLDPMMSLPFLTDHIMRKYNKIKENKKNVQSDLVKPGAESVRHNREEMTLY